MAIRVAHALGLPVVTGVKAITAEDGSLRCEQEVPGGRDVYVVPMPAVVTVKEGINLPRYPSVPGRLRAKRKPLEASSPARPEPRLEMVRLALPPGSGKQVEILGNGAEAAPPVVGVLRESGAGLMGVLVFVEDPEDELSQQALAFAARSGRGGPRRRDRRPRRLRPGRLGDRRSQRPPGTAARRRSSPRAPTAATRCWRTSRRCSTCRWPPTARRSPPGDPATVTRVRWGGSLLEEARLHGSPRCHGRAPRGAPRTAADAVAELETIELAAEAVVRVSERVQAQAAGVSLTDADVVVSGGRGVGSAEGFAVIEELAELLGGAVGCSRAVTSAGWRPHTDQVGQTGTKISPEIYIACGISGATQHMAGCKGAKKLLAINPDAEASIFASADYAVIGDLHEVVPAISAEIRKVRGG